MKGNKLKSISIILIICLMAFSAVGCGSNDGDSSSAEKSGETKTMAILMMSVADEFIYSVGKKTQQYAESLGYEVTFLNANNDAAVQASQINDVIAKGIDSIVLAPVDAAALSDSVKLINEANIPVTLIDRTVTTGNYVSVNQADNTQCGYQGGVALVEQAKAQGIAVEDLKVLELMGDLASTSGLERSQGFQKAAAELGFTIVASLPTYWKADTAYSATLDAFQTDGNINAIFCASDGVMADSVTNALDQMQKLKKKGEAGHIVIATVDGTPGVIKYITEGYIDASCSQPAFDMATKSVDDLELALAGEVNYDASINNALAPGIITSENATSEEFWANNL
jgi:ABC-type sugar transport system substrate-binding protein